MSGVGDGRTLLVVEDDEALRARLAVAMTRRGFEVSVASSVAEARARTSADAPELAIVDLRLGDGDGRDVVDHLHRIEPRTVIVLLTGYGSIATALDAVQRGAAWVLTKPADADDILAAFARADDELRDALGTRDDPPPLRAPSLDRMEWEHIQRVLEDCGGNISHAADALGIHRRSLQRKLSRRPSVK